MNNPFNFFDKIYCINLSERTDRWNECLKNFERYEKEFYSKSGLTAVVKLSTIL